MTECRLTRCQFQNEGSMRLPCDNRIINRIKQNVLDYFWLEIDRTVRGANLQKICTCYPRIVWLAPPPIFARSRISWELREVTSNI
jgi:hypothetical protein